MRFGRGARAAWAMFVLLGATPACGGPASRPGGPAQGVPGAAQDGAAPGVAAVAGSRACTEPARTDRGDARDRGIDAFLEDRPREAAAILSDVVRARPGDAAAEVFRDASVTKLSLANARAGDDASGAAAVTLSRIPLVRSAGAIPSSGPKLRLDKESEAKNLIVDDADWLAKHQLTPRTRRGRDDLPEHIPQSFRSAQLLTLFSSADHDIGDYGRWLVAAAPGKKPRVFDAAQAMSSGPRPFEINFAQLVGDALVVQLAYNGYANETGGKTGYVAAFNAGTGRLLWSTEALVGNFTNFHVAGWSLVTGYGFTAEPDFLFVLDLVNGEIGQKIPLKSGPHAIIAKGDKLFVRTYDTDYVFRAAGSLPPAPPASLAPAGASRPQSINPEARCWVRAAAAAIERGDAGALGEAMQMLGPISKDRVLYDALERARASLDARGRGEGPLDLKSAQPIVVPRPPWSYTVVAAGPAPQGKPPTLVKSAAGEADPVRALAKQPFRADRPVFIAPVNRGALPPGAPRNIPSAYGLEDLRAIIPSGDRSLLIYGGRYLVSVTGRAVERIFDLDALRHPPDPNPQWKEFAVQDVTYAQVKDGTLYVCNGGGSYAREVKGKKGFMTALDLATGKMLWRSEPLVCNATFALAGDYLVTGYGFTDEPDFIFLLRRSDGRIVQRVPIDTGPSEIILDGGRVFVEAYAHRYLFELRP